MINKYNYITGDILARYDSIKDVCEHDNVSYHTVYKMLQQKVLKYPRYNWYYAYEPKPRYIVECYDNECWELLGQYINIKQASERTAVDASQIQWQVARNKPFTERRQGDTGLWFVRKLIT